jgi:hypothetical protein
MLTTIVSAALLWTVAALAMARKHLWDVLILGASAMAQLAVVVTAQIAGATRDRTVDIAHWVLVIAFVLTPLVASHTATLGTIVALAALTIASRTYRRAHGLRPCLFRSEGGLSTLPRTGMGSYDADLASALVILVAGCRLMARDRST